MGDNILDLQSPDTSLVEGAFDVPLVAEYSPTISVNPNSAGHQQSGVAWIRSRQLNWVRMRCQSLILLECNKTGVEV